MDKQLSVGIVVRCRACKRESIAMSPRGPVEAGDFHVCAGCCCVHVFTPGLQVRPAHQCDVDDLHDDVLDQLNEERFRVFRALISGDQHDQ